MKPVTLYSANKQMVMSYSMDYLTQHHYARPAELLFARNSDKIFDKQEVEVKNLPIERFCWGNAQGITKEVFAAFDEELREIIGCSQEKFNRDLKEATDRCVKREYTQLLAVKDDHKALIELSPWRSMVWAIKKIWRNK